MSRNSRVHEEGWFLVPHPHPASQYQASEQSLYFQLVLVMKTELLDVFWRVGDVLCQHLGTILLKVQDFLQHSCQSPSGNRRGGGRSLKNIYIWRQQQSSFTSISISVHGQTSHSTVEAAMTSSYRDKLQHLVFLSCFLCFSFVQHLHKPWMFLCQTSGFSMLRNPE